MKKALKIIILLQILLLSFSCNKEDISKGIIIDDIYFDSCILRSIEKNTESEQIITSDSLYQNLYQDNKEMIEQICPNFVLPNIDFEQYTLLGKYISIGGKIKYCEKEVIKDKTNSCYTYNLIIHTKDFRKIEATNMYWVLVPKLPENYTVTFIVTEK